MKYQAAVCFQIWNPGHCPSLVNRPRWRWGCDSSRCRITYRLIKDTNLVSLDKVDDLSMPQFPLIRNDNKDSHLMGSVRIKWISIFKVLRIFPVKSYWRLLNKVSRLFSRENVGVLQDRVLYVQLEVFTQFLHLW